MSYDASESERVESLKGEGEYMMLLVAVILKEL